MQQQQQKEGVVSHLIIVLFLGDVMRRIGQQQQVIERPLCINAEAKAEVAIALCLLLHKIVCTNKSKQPRKCVCARNALSIVHVQSNLSNVISFHANKKKKRKLLTPSMLMLKARR